MNFNHDPVDNCLNFIRTVINRKNNEILELKNEITFLKNVIMKQKTTISHQKQMIAIHQRSHNNIQTQKQLKSHQQQRRKEVEKEVFDYFNKNNLFHNELGCTQAQFDSIYNLCRPIFEKYTHTGQERKRSQHNDYFYSNKFQLLVTLFWLRMYVGEVFISRIFNISQRLVNKFINRCINVLYESVANSFIGFDRKKLILWKNEFSTITHHVPNACVVIDGTEIKINKSSNKEIEKEEYSSKKRIHSVNVLVAVLLNGRCIYVSDACPVSHDQRQWNMLNLRRHFEGIPVGIIGDAGFHFNPVNVLKSGRPFILWLSNQDI